jgi:hypothetical protein
MSAPAPRKPCQDGGRWETIRYALDSWARTLRLCLILIVLVATPTAAGVVASDIARAATNTQPACVLRSAAEPVELLDGAQWSGEAAGLPSAGQTTREGDPCQPQGASRA